MSKYPKEVDRAKAKELSMQWSELGNESGVFTTSNLRHYNVFIFSVCRFVCLKFSFRFSNVLNLKESSTLLLSATRLHGKQDKLEGSEHMKDEKETENKQIRKKVWLTPVIPVFCEISNFF